MFTLTSTRTAVFPNKANKINLLMLFSIVASLLFFSAVHASDEDSVQKVISKQIEAFQKGDDETAFSFAAPNIRAAFKTTERFITMVKKGYRPVYQPRSYQFKEFRQDGETVSYQTLRIVGPNSKIWLALYKLQRQDDAITWKINGVWLKPAPALES